MTASERIRAARELWGDGPYHVNPYSVSREYGGPEEGGWWFDHGYPMTSLSSRIFDSLEDALSYRDDLNRAEGESTRFRVHGPSDLVWYIEAQEPHEWFSSPGNHEVPYYE